jgi:hypothetical protein
MLLRFQKAVVRGNYDTGNQAFSMRFEIFDHTGVSFDFRAKPESLISAHSPKLD